MRVLFSYAFRPFFLLATLYAIVVVPLWAAAWLGHLPMPSSLGTPIAWHAHEMIYGFAGAAIAMRSLSDIENDAIGCVDDLLRKCVHEPRGIVRDERTYLLASRWTIVVVGAITSWVVVGDVELDTTGDGSAAGSSTWAAISARSKPHVL